jgi:hypothetical protein
MSIQYPLFLIPHGGGFASIVDPESGSFHLLVAYSEEAPAVEFMSRFGLADEPRFLKNDREFAWLLLALRDPVTHVAFDPRIEDGVVSTRWSVAVKELLEQHLRPDTSPWNYPSFVIEMEGGFASIAGRASDERAMTAVALFTTRSKAEDYLDRAGESGSITALNDVEEVRDFLTQLTPQVAAVALDPTVEAEGSRAEYCFDIPTLLEKYLVRDTPQE